ncbi:MAG: hypothetical protein R3B96_06750 [Pirellulaceae bacterium]
MSRSMRQAGLTIPLIDAYVRNVSDGQHAIAYGPSNYQSSTGRTYVDAMTNTPNYFGIWSEPGDVTPLRPAATLAPGGPEAQYERQSLAREQRHPFSLFTANFRPLGG